MRAVSEVISNLFACLLSFAGVRYVHIVKVKRAVPEEVSKTRSVNRYGRVPGIKLSGTRRAAAAQLTQLSPEKHSLASKNRPHTLVIASVFNDALAVTCGLSPVVFR